MLGKLPILRLAPTIAGLRIPALGGSVAPKQLLVVAVVSGELVRLKFTLVVDAGSSHQQKIAKKGLGTRSSSQSFFVDPSYPNPL